ncbi:hypothetical protein [Nocardioides terrigena]|uniref:hypothetical protein n=1 Tax=Nocardioides terrigena TaxID=424797 RepID=UPI00131EE5E3|nr:hypothetical protein [Nocardioides terrigena]
MSVRYFVERTRDNFEDVGAESCDLDPCGALIFTQENDEVYVIAPGGWLTMTSEIEAD